MLSGETSTAVDTKKQWPLQLEEQGGRRRNGRQQPGSTYPILTTQSDVNKTNTKRKTIQKKWPRRWQRLLEMLMADPPASYADISDELELPIGSIGPTRGRCLARLRVLLQAS